MKQSKLIAILLLLSCFSRYAMAQVPENSGFRDFTWHNADHSEQTAYDLLQKGKMILLVSGIRGTEATEDLISSSILQRISQEHGLTTQPGVQPYTTNDVQVVFFNDPSNAVAASLQSLPFPATTNVSNAELISGGLVPRITLITPDRIAHPLAYENADAASLYQAISNYKTLYTPTATPDVRLLRCITQPVYSNCTFSADVYFQNYSTSQLKSVTFTLWAGNKVVAVKEWKGALASLETNSMHISGSVPENVPVKITMSTPGELFTVNNTWKSAGKNVYGVAGAMSLPFTTHFGSQLPENWIAGDDAMFSVVAINHKEADNHALRIRFNKKMPLQSDTLYMGHYNLGEHPFMNFNWAYAPSSEYAGANLMVIASADEGKTWEAIKTFDDSKLATAGVQTYTQLPQGRRAWRKEYVNLQEVAGKNNVWIALVAVADFTNDGYLSNLYLFNDPATMAIR